MKKLQSPNTPDLPTWFWIIVVLIKLGGIGLAVWHLLTR